MADSQPLWRWAVAEGIGTYFLVLIGPGAVMVDARTQGSLGPVGIALSFTFVIAAMVFVFGRTSGAHLNPAITITFWLIRRAPPAKVLIYVAAQCSGAIAAAFTLRAVLGNVGSVGATLPSVSTPSAFAVEWLLSFVLMTVILAACDHSTSHVSSAFVIGATVGFDALVGGALTGASMNPARSLGPAVASGLWKAHWIYWLAPILGMLAAAVCASIYSRSPAVTSTTEPVHS